MQVLFIRNYKMKALYFALILVFWVCLFLLTSTMIKNKLLYTVSIDQYLSFSYPPGFQMDQVYADKRLMNHVVETNGPLHGISLQQVLNYSSPEGHFGFSYPDSFSLNPKTFEGGEILYHIDFHSNRDHVQGFVQVWHLPGSLEAFLSASKAASQQNFKYFGSKPETVNGLSGTLWDYAILTQSGESIKGLELFLKKGDRMYRISYFVPENEWSSKQYDIFWSMANSLKV